ncbi:MAG TPA: hypothetical protein VLM38_18635 [Blastocatellia bacterium]|nr:hypothetical protein [Blastocatellia bacterium]
MPDKANFATVFSKLKAILEPYASKLVVSADTPGNYSLETRHIMKNKKPLFFAGVRKGKNYVSFYLMSVYASPDVHDDISPELKKRMQGKSCFNFATVDEKLFKELAKLTKTGFARFSDERFIAALRNLQ